MSRKRLDFVPGAVRQATPTSCFRACVATVFGIEFDDVPECCDAMTWDWLAFQSWLAQYGLQAIEVGFEAGGCLYPVSEPVRCILSGYSPRSTGILHAVVADFVGAEGFQLLHDPHTDDLWIDGEPTHATFFVPLSMPTLAVGGIDPDDVDTRYRYRWIYSESVGDWHHIDLSAGATQGNCLGWIFKSIEDSGYAHAVRWSGFEWEKMPEVMKLSCECSAELFVGFFGADADGNQPECRHTNVREVDGQSVRYEDGEMHLEHEDKCEKCGAIIDTNQVWSEV